MLIELDITAVLVPLLPHQALSIYLHTCTTVVYLMNLLLWEFILQQQWLLKT